MDQRRVPRPQRRASPGRRSGTARFTQGAAWTTVVAALVLALVLPSCSETGTPEPPYFNVLTVEGTPYERGLQHGTALHGEIRYFYTKFLSAGLVPWLNRERKTIADALQVYWGEEYDDGRFGYRLLLDSGLSLLGLEFCEDTQDYVNIGRPAPNPLQEYIDELRGVSDGSGVDFSRIVILNTFLDTLFGMRAIIFAIRNLEEPRVMSVAFEQQQGGQWVEVDLVNPFQPSPFASITEIPTDARIRLTLADQISPLTLLQHLGQDDEEDRPIREILEEIRPKFGIDQGSIRIQLNRQVFQYNPEDPASTPAVSVSVPSNRPGRLEVVLEPPEPMEPAALQSLQIQAGDLDFTTSLPMHSNVMRDERTAFTTEGYAARYDIGEDELHRIPNLGDLDERLQPTSLSFAVRGSATTGGQVLAAHHFTGLDNDTAHRSGAVIVHIPDEGIPFITVGIAGVIWGSSGMSGDGLAFMYNLSDSHDNPVTEEFLNNLLDARLVSSGTPIGILMRKMMQATGNALDAAEYLKELKDQKMSFSWNILLADAQRNLVAVERTANITPPAWAFWMPEDPNGGHYAYAPVNPSYPSPSQADLDPWGRPWASVGEDDLRMAQHFQANEEDYRFLWLLPEQRYWTSYYYRSLRVFYLLRDEIEAAYGNLDLQGVERILRLPEMNDIRNSMNSAIYAPDELKMWFALGEVPATGAPYREVDFGALIGR